MVVVNETFVRTTFGEEDPIGKRISGWAPDNTPEWREIVGVVGDVRSFGQENEHPAEMYMPLTQAPDGVVERVPALHDDRRARTTGHHGCIARFERRWPTSIRCFPLFDVQTTRRRSHAVHGDAAIQHELLTLLGATGLILAAIGIYGVIAFFVTQRTHEIGVRVALGASTRSVIRMVVGQALTLALIGVTLGGLAAFWATRVLGNMLFAVGARDPIAYVGAAVLLLIVALGAAWLPARRAARVDPISALAANG